MPTAPAILPGDLQRLVTASHPTADRIVMVGHHDAFRGVTFTTGTRKFWWADTTGTIAPDPLPSRADAADALDARTNPALAAVPAYTLDDENSQAIFFVDFTDPARPAPDTSHPHLPGYPAIRPKRLKIILVPHQSHGGGLVWEVAFALVVGPQVLSAYRLSKRDDTLRFRDPLTNGLVLDDGSEGRLITPGWIRVIAARFRDRLNGIAE